MVLEVKSKIYSVSGISDEQKQQIICFLQGAVYSWCKNAPKDSEWFSLRDLVGGHKHYWVGTPLLCLYNRHHGQADDPVKKAGIDAGMLLKRTLDLDRRVFETNRVERPVQYRMKGGTGGVDV